MQYAQIPRGLAVPFASQAGAEYVRQVPTAAQPGGAASLVQGFPPETFQPVASGGVPPSGADMNGILLDTTGWARWAKAGCPVLFDAAFAAAVGGYPRYAVLSSVTIGTIWQSTVDNNQTDPDAGPSSDWTAIATAPGTTNGNFYKLPNGVIEQWGDVAFSSTGEPVVSASLPVSFSDAFYNVTVTPYVTSATTRADSWVQLITSSRTPNGFSVQYQNSDASRARLDGFTWRAVGR